MKLAADRYALRLPLLRMSLNNTLTANKTITLDHIRTFLAPVNRREKA